MKPNNRPAIEVGYGMAKDESAFVAGAKAAEMALASIHLHSISAVMVFCSVSYDLNEVLTGIHSVVGESSVFGVTTAGEICDEFVNGTVTVVAIASPFLRVHCGIGNGVSQDWRQAVAQTINAPSLRPFFHDSQYTWEMRRQGRTAFAMLFSPGNTLENDSCSFEIIEAIKAESYGEFQIVGGAAADDWRMEKNYILCGQEVYNDSMLLAIFETELQFGISLMHGLYPTKITATVTAVDGNEILMLDDTVAAEAYCKLLGFTEKELAGQHLSIATGTTIGVADATGQYNVNVASYFTERGGIRLEKPISMGSVITKMDADPDKMALAGGGGIRLARIRGGITDPALGLVFYCALRQRLIDNKAVAEIAGMKEVLSGKPLVGFCCFGEHGVTDIGDSRYNNLSVACLVIGSQLSHTGRVAVENRELLEELEAQKAELISTNQALMQANYEHLKTEAALRANKTKLTDFVQAVPDVSLIIDEDGRYVEIFGNSNKEKVTWPTPEFCGLTVYDAFSKKDADAMLEQVRQTILSGMPQVMIREVEIFEKRIVIEGRMAPMTYQAQGKKTVALVAIDITERWKAERLLRFTYELRRKSDFINDILAGNATVDNHALSTANSFGIDFALPLFCCLVAIKKNSTLVEEHDDSIIDIQLKDDIIDLLSSDSDYLVWDCRDGIGILCQIKEVDDGYETSLQIAGAIKEKIKEYASNLTVIIGVSNKHSGLHGVRLGYRQAWSALVSSQCQDQSSGCVNHYRNLGIFQLLANIGGKEQANEFVREKVGNLIDYDQRKGTDFLSTLEEILQSSNLKEAADKLYLHHKTIVFRKQRIEKILGVDIDQYESRLALAAAVKLNKLNMVINQ
ncbi:MAG: carbohydrate diacid transcriptional activator CdaR [Firmicutes bacterium]|nr:carbohydrate diacid transcriptional activator CdaR [Bacillota bacterium]